MNCCVVCSAGDHSLVALSCLHWVHPACVAPECPECRSGSGTLGAAIEANSLADAGDMDYLHRLPQRSFTAEGWTINVYDAKTVSGQGAGGDDGAWVMVLRDGALNAWNLNKPHIVHWRGGCNEDGPRGLGVRRLTAGDMPHFAATVERFDVRLGQFLYLLRGARVEILE